jgi:hypothetical protein
VPLELDPAPLQIQVPVLLTVSSFIVLHDAR